MRFRQCAKLLVAAGFTLLVGAFAQFVGAQDQPKDAPKIQTRKYDFKEAGKQMEYCVFVPSKYAKDKKTPLIVVLHGLLGTPQMILGYKGMTDLAEKHGYILAAPMGYNPVGWYGAKPVLKIKADPENLGELSEKDVMNVLALARKEFNVDDNRIYLMGHSMGGGGTWHLGIKYPDIWAGLAPIAPATAMDPAELKKITHIPVMLVQGDKDTLVPPAPARLWAAKMKELKMTSEYIEVAGGDHMNVATTELPKIFEFFNKHQKPAKTTPIAKYLFAPSQPVDGYTLVKPETLYTKQRGFGFDCGSKVTAVAQGRANPLHRGYCTSDGPMYFSVALPEGNYDVTVTLRPLGGPATVRAESRRLMLENLQPGTDGLVTQTFTTNIRTSKLKNGGEVKLKDRELKGPLSSPALHWDDKLTVEVRGQGIGLVALEIVKNDSAITVYLAGDSTVTDQTQTNETFTSWGQMLTRFFKPHVVSIANHAESGEATTSFIGAKRLEKITDTLKKGDYLLIQFGHNDQNQMRDIPTYKKTLQRYLAEARKREAIPILVTPMRRRTFDNAGKSTNTLGDFPDAVRQLAKEEKVMLIDLNLWSKDFYEALGPTNSPTAFAPMDNTHHNLYGAFEFARYIAEVIKRSDLPLAKHVIDDLPAANFKGPKK
ncbi:MAG TPA: GDSL-type esterase/lipase family protein [Gemmataceae bacterium]|nr:GDSL-type esterase/lipase family protein [Gemmataceae bacterium]